MLQLKRPQRPQNFPVRPMIAHSIRIPATIVPFGPVSAQNCADANIGPGVAATADDAENPHLLLHVQLRIAGRERSFGPPARPYRPPAAMPGKPGKSASCPDRGGPSRRVTGPLGLFAIELRLTASAAAGRSPLCAAVSAPRRPRRMRWPGCPVEPIDFWDVLAASQFAREFPHISKHKNPPV